MTTIPTTTERIAEATRFLRFVMKAGSIHELRADAKEGFISGRYNSPEQMAKTGVLLQAKYGLNAIYYGLNAAKPDAKFGAATVNTIQRKPARGGAAKDSSIMHRSLYAIDIDSTRPKGMMATEEQHQGTVALAHRVIDFIRTRIPEWPEPIWVHSGNGTHLVWRGDQCDANSSVWRYCLQRLSTEVTSAGAHVDSSVFNASRILRLPGSINVKGPDTPDTPHRMVRVMQYPKQWVSVDHGPHVYRLARALGYSEETAAAQRQSSGIEGDVAMVMALINEYPELLNYVGTVEDDEKTKVVIAECPFVGRRHSGGNSAILIYNDGAIRYKCFAESCPGKGFGSLLRLLKERTGRESETFRHDRPLTEREIAVWGEIEEAPLYINQPDTSAKESSASTEKENVMHTAQQSPEAPAPTSSTESTLSPAEAEFISAAIAQDPRSIPESIKTVDWTNCPLSIHPDAWGLTLNDIAATYRRKSARQLAGISDPIARKEFQLRYTRVKDTNDLQAMGRYLGYIWLATIAGNKQTRPTIDHNHILTAGEMLALVEAA